MSDLVTKINDLAAAVGGEVKALDTRVDALEAGGVGSGDSYSPSNKVPLGGGDLSELAATGSLGSRTQSASVYVEFTPTIPFSLAGLKIEGFDPDSPAVSLRVWRVTDTVLMGNTGSVTPGVDGVASGLFVGGSANLVPGVPYRLGYGRETSTSPYLVPFSNFPALAGFTPGPDAWYRPSGAPWTSFPDSDMGTGTYPRLTLLSVPESGVTGQLPLTSLETSGTPSDTTFLRGDGAWAEVEVPDLGPLTQRVDDLESVEQTTQVPSGTPVDGEPGVWDIGLPIEYGTLGVIYDANGAEYPRGDLSPQTYYQSEAVLIREGASPIAWPLTVYSTVRTDDFASRLAERVAEVEARPVTPRSVFVQNDAPEASGPFLWIQTGLGAGGNDFTIWFDDGSS